MALTIAGTAVAPVKIIDQFTAPAGEAIDAGEVVRLDPENGKLMLAGGTTVPGKSGLIGVAIGSANVANIAVTAVSKGLIDLGTALAGISFGGSIYLDNTAGAMGTAAGSVALVIGDVVPGFAAGTAADRLLRLDFGI